MLFSEDLTYLQQYFASYLRTSPSVFSTSELFTPTYTTLIHYYCLEFSFHQYLHFNIITTGGPHDYSLNPNYLCAPNFYLTWLDFGQKIFAIKRKSTISNHGIILSESFISTFSKYFESPKSVWRFCNKISFLLSYQLSVDHPAL